MRTSQDTTDAPRPRAKVILLAGPSGSGKSHLAERLGVPHLRLDDFYKDGDDPTLPIGELGIPDWDDPAAWDAELAVATLTELARTGRAVVPVYELSQDRTVGTVEVELGDAEVFVAEGIFAADIVAACRDAGILADAVCLLHRPTITFWRRLIRDLREGRKAPTTLLRRGLALRRREPEIVARLISLGAEPVQGRDALARLRRVVEEQRRARRDGLGDVAA